MEGLIQFLYCCSIRIIFSKYIARRLPYTNKNCNWLIFKLVFYVTFINQMIHNKLKNLKTKILLDFEEKDAK